MAGLLDSLFSSGSPGTMGTSAAGLLSPPAQPKGFLPGLLSDPWLRLGLGLLEQGGPSARPHSFGQDLSRAVGGLRSQDDEEAQRELQREELERRKRMNAKAEQDQERQNAFMQQMLQMMGGAAPGGGAAAPPPVAPSIMPPPPGAPPAPVEASPLGPPSPFKRNNPGNLRPVGASTGFQEFGDPKAGLAALVQNLRSYGGKGINTLEGVVSRWAPPNENPTPQLIQNAAMRMGLAPNAQIDLNDPSLLGKLSRAIVAQEYGDKGAGYFSDEDYAAAVGDGSAPETPPPAPTPTPSFTPGGMAGLPPMPKEVRDTLMMTAYQQSGGDPVRMMQAFGKAQQDWVLANAKAGTEAAAQAPFKAAQAELESDLGTQRDAAKSARTYSEEEQKLFAKDFDEINKRGQAGASKAARVGTLGNLLEQTYTGAGGETLQDLKRLASSLGIEMEGVGEGDTARAVANSIALELRSTGEGAGMPGALSDKDREFLVAMAPGLTKTPEGNKLLVEYWKRLAKREQAVATKAREYKKKNGGRFDDGFYDELQAWADKNPLFPDKPPAASSAKGPAAMPYSQSDLEFTAKKHGITVEEVKRRLGVK